MTVLLSQTAFGFSITRISESVSESREAGVTAGVNNPPQGFTLSYRWVIDETQTATAYHNALAGVTTDESDLTFTAPDIDSGVDSITLFIRLTVTAIKAGETDLTATGIRDVITVTNSDPMPTPEGTIPNQILNLGVDSTLDVAEFFTYETLTYTVKSSDTATVTAKTSGSLLTLTPVAEGTTTITVTAMVSDSPSYTVRMASQTFMVTVRKGLTTSDITNLNNKILPILTQAVAASAISAVGHRIDAAFSVPNTANYNLDGELSAGLRGTMMKKLPTYAKSLQNDTLDWKQMLGNSSFVLPLNATDGDDAGNAGAGAAIWGSGDYRRLDSDGDVNWEGSLFSVQLGMDKRIRDNLLVGGLLSSSKGDIDYTLDASKGKYSHKMTSVHPYLAWSEAGVSLWGSVGYGRGKLDIKESNRKSSADTNLLSLAGGVNRALPQSGMSLKSDISLARTDIKASADGNIGKQTINSQRLRLILEMGRERVLASGVLKPSLEIGLRYDGGDGDTGVGAVLGAGLRYANATGLSMEGKVHALVGRKKYQEWGVSGVIRQQTGAGGHGLAFSLSPSYGQTGSNANQVWQGVPEGNSADDSAKLNINIGYGLSAPNGGLLTPYSEVTLGERARNYRLGLRWKPDSPFDLHLVGEREESSGENHNRILLESRIWF